MTGQRHNLVLENEGEVGGREGNTQNNADADNHQNSMTVSRPSVLMFIATRTSRVLNMNKHHLHFTRVPLLHSLPLPPPQPRDQRVRNQKT